MKASTVPPTPPSVVAQIAGLPDLSMDEIKALWRRLFGNDNPTPNRQFMERRIAYKLQEIEFRTPADPMDAPPPLFSGDKLVAWPSGYETDARVFVTNDKPTPLTLVAVFPQVVVQDAR